MKPTYEELEHQLEKTEKLLKQALNHVIKLEGRIAKLEEQLKLNSKNSSKPPSADQKANTKKRPPKNLEKDILESTVPLIQKKESIVTSNAHEKPVPIAASIPFKKTPFHPITYNK
jgi:uncharacterized protein (DUF342 family)